MSRTVILQVVANNLVARQMVGNVTRSSKDGTVTVEYKEPGQVKTTKKVFQADSVLYRLGEGTGFVIAETNTPLVTFVGKLSTNKAGEAIVETADGDVVINRLVGSQTIYNEVAEDSKEARAAERAGKVKSRVKATSEKGDRKSKKKKRSRDEDDAPAKKKKKKKKSRD